MTVVNDLLHTEIKAFKSKINMSEMKLSQNTNAQENKTVSIVADHLTMA